MQAFVSRLAKLTIANQPVTDMGNILSVRAFLNNGVGLEANMASDRSSAQVVGSKSATCVITFGIPAVGQSLPVFANIDWINVQYDLVLYNATDIYNPQNSRGGNTIILQGIAWSNQSADWTNQIRAATEGDVFIAQNFDIIPANNG